MSLTYSRIITAAGVIAALAIATPSFAGQGNSRRVRSNEQNAQSNESHSRRATSREEARPPAPAVRPSLPPQASNSPRHDRPARVSAPEPVQQSRGNVIGRAVPRSPQRPVVVADHHDARPVYGPGRPVVVAPRHVVVAPRYVVVAPRPAWGHFTRGYYAPIHVVHYYQPYYVFRPRVSFSFGLTIGHPVAYPVWYDPYPVYGYALGPRYGGISFDMQPSDAAIFIDGGYVGIVDDFSPYDAPLTLRAGLHRVEIRGRDCQPMLFDITVVPGQVIPYRGALAYGR